MILRNALISTVLAVGCLTSGCSTTGRITAPSPGDASGQSGSSQESQRQPPPAPPTTPPSSGTCDVEKARFALGQRATDDLLARARQAAGASVARFLRPNQPITTEYLGSRLNLGLDERDVVRSVNCG